MSLERSGSPRGLCRVSQSPLRHRMVRRAVERGRARPCGSQPVGPLSAGFGRADSSAGRPAPPGPGRRAHTVGRPRRRDGAEIPHLLRQEGGDRRRPAGAGEHLRRSRRRFCGRQAGAIAPVDPARIHQSQIRLVDQGRRLESVAGGFSAQILGRQPVQLVVNDWEHLVEPCLPLRSQSRSHWVTAPGG